MNTLLMQRKTLYILPDAPKRLDADIANDVFQLRDADMPHTITRSVGADLLLRIHINSRVDLAAAALQLAARKQIPISVENGRHDVCAHILPATPYPDPLIRTLGAVIDSPEWIHAFDDWYHTQRQAILSRVLLSCGVWVKRENLDQAETTLRFAHARRNPNSQATEQRLRALQALVRIGFIAQASAENPISSDAADTSALIRVFERTAELLQINAHIPVHYARPAPSASGEDAALWARQTYEHHRIRWLEQGQSLLLQLHALAIRCC